MKREEENPFKIAWKDQAVGRRSVERQNVKWRGSVKGNVREVNLENNEVKDRPY